MAAEKTDLHKLYKDEYIAPEQPRFIRSLKANYLTVFGTGEPGIAPFRDKIRILYSVARAVRAAKRQDGQDFTLCKMEALWWGPDEGGEIFDWPKPKWNWKLLVRVPHYVKEEDRLAAVLEMIDNGRDPSLLNEVIYESLKEGLCVQMLHAGTYGSAPESIARMKAFATQEGLAFRGYHHEIYLATPPGPIRTILRRPVG